MLWAKIHTKCFVVAVVVIFYLCFANCNFIDSYKKLQRDGVSDPTKLRFADKELTYIAAHLTVPKQQQYARCVVVGTSEELYAEKHGRNIDSADIVVRVGYSHHSLLKTYRDEGGTLKSDVNFSEGRHTEIVGMKMNYIYSDVASIKSIVDALTDSMKVQGTVVVTSLADVRDVRTLYNFMKNAPTVPIALLSARSVDMMWKNFYNKNVVNVSPTLIFYGVAVCRQLTQKYPIEVYGGYENFHNAIIEDDSIIHSENDPHCSASKTLHADDDPSWKALTSDPGVQLVGSSWHKKLYKMIHSRKPSAIPLLTPSSNCPIHLSNKPFRRCAVVGAAPHIGCNHFGNEIDQHDAIFRTNSHLPVVNQTHIMGERTTHVVYQAPYFVNTLQHSGCARVLPELDGDIIICSSRKSTETLLKQHGLIASFNSTLLKHWGEYGFSQHIKTSYSNPDATSFSTFVSSLGRPDAYIKSTTGMMAVVYAMDLCKTIDIYGFSVGNLQLGIHSFIIELMALRTIELECPDRFHLKLPDEDNYKLYIDAWRSMNISLFYDE